MSDKCSVCGEVVDGRPIDWLTLLKVDGYGVDRRSEEYSISCCRKCFSHIFDTVKPKSPPRVYQ